MACVSHARELLHIYWLFYMAVSMVTGMTEEGLRHFIEMPLVQNLFEEFGSMTDLSNLSSVTKGTHGNKVFMQRGTDVIS